MIAILGILATMTYVSLKGVREKGRDSKRIAEIVQISKALDVYFLQHGQYPDFPATADACGHTAVYYRNLGVPGTVWTDVDFACVWSDLLNVLTTDGFIGRADFNNYTSQESPWLKIKTALANIYNTTVQDPKFNQANPNSNHQTYAYMPAKNCTGSGASAVCSPQNYRLRIRLENINNPLLISNGFNNQDFAYEGPGGPPDNDYLESSCTGSRGYYCIGPENIAYHAYESGKPVIYLYPTKETKVTVKIAPKQVANSIPTYNNGWQVMAYPDGHLVNLSDQKTYPYLFWDGPSYKPTVDKTKGFVIATSEIEKFLAEKLTAQGLKQSEYSEFIDYWAPRMKSKAYVYVYFMPQTDYDKLVPMNIEPWPDTIVRIYMLFKSLDQPINVEPQVFNPPARNGFTVIEWGGDRSEIK